MKKILFIANTAIKNGDKPDKLTNFTIPSYLAAKAVGYEFHMTTDYKHPEEISVQYDDIKFHTIGIYRNPFSMDVLKAYKDLNRLLNEENFDAIHCNTPIGGALGRLCGKKAKVPKIIYTVHGFHFYKGAPLVNKTIFKWIEKWLAHFTDAILTINQEDFVAAQKFKLRQGGKTFYVPGVGIDTDMYQVDNFDSKEFRQSLGLSSEDIILIAMGDLIDRKNYTSSIKAIAKANNQKLHFLICGRGPKLEALQKLASDLGVEKQIHFLGFRNDIKELLTMADIFLFTTYQEGLPRSMMEAMSAGLPCIASKVRGNVDLIQEGVGGFLRDPDDSEGFAESINILASDKALREKMKASNLETIKKFDVENVKKQIKKIYESELR